MAIQHFTRKGLDAEPAEVRRLMRLESHFVPEHLKNADEAEVARRAQAGELANNAMGSLWARAWMSRN